jgi:hypothetical protein
MPPDISLPKAMQGADINYWFNESYKMMDQLSNVLEYQSYKDRASAIAVLIDALHHDYAIQMQMEVDGS